MESASLQKSHTPMEAAATPPPGSYNHLESVLAIAIRCWLPCPGCIRPGSDHLRMVQTGGKRRWQETAGRMIMWISPETQQELCFLVEKDMLYPPRLAF
jgi:hypothetical protein